MSPGLKLWLPGLAAVWCVGAHAAAWEPEQSVVKIMTFRQEPDWSEPWKFQPTQGASGSGFVIAGQRVMTNAHVVGWAKQIQLMRYQDPKPYAAAVEYVGHDCDLAVLRVEDPAFFKDMKPLSFGELPAVRSTVVTYGYPAGGQQISYTRGVVSRIEMQGYVHQANRSFLTVQTDAAINPGNSGGPVVQDNKVVGVAFQGTRALENTGFFIPPTIVAHFLEDIRDGKYDGFTDAGMLLTELVNPAYRRHLGLGDDGRGARIDSILLPFPETLERLQPEDVLLEVNGYAVGSDAMIQYRGNRVAAGVAFDLAQQGESVELKIWRGGKELGVTLPVSVYTADRMEGNQYDTPPRYLIYGGLIFTPLSKDYVESLGREWAKTVDNEAIYELTLGRRVPQEVDRKEPVMLAGILPHPINANMRIKGGAMLDRINGRTITCMEDVVAALADGENGTQTFEFVPYQRMECLHRAEAEAAQEEILKTYRVPEDRRL